MNPSNLVGRIMRIVEADQYRILLEDDNVGQPTNKFVIIEARSVEGVSHGFLEVANLVKK